VRQPKLARELGRSEHVMRNKRLDILRCVAVLLVLGRHGFMQGLWLEVGWAGVDLFFVLSGFLISGLLFSEYKKTGTMNLRRFFIRRGFKIYPAFWAMLLGSVLIAFAYHKHFYAPMWLHEILFVQNYLPGVWRHTWSLAVEEHFYIVLPLLLLVMFRLSKNRKDPFWFIPYAFCILAPITLVMRYIAVHQPSYQPALFGRVMFLTHLRIDSLFFGVVLGYFYHFHTARVVAALQKRGNRLMLEAATALLIGCCVGFAVESPFMQSFGLTLVYLGFGGLLMLCLTAPPPREASSGANTAWLRISGALAFVGAYSYSIYLWHIPVQIIGTNTLNALSPVPLSPALLTWIYAAVSIPFGILMARLVEFPVLRLRDKLFPRVSQPVELAHVETTDSEARLRPDPVLT
jgi:peptidoglycan/LPS O-acetylase OafA/YrhL